MIFRAITLLAGTFLGYNFAIMLALIVVAGGIILINKVFTAFEFISIAAVFQPWLEWVIQHFSLCLPILVIIYIGGWFGFIYRFVMAVTQDLPLEN